MNLSVQWDIKYLLQAADRMAVQKHLQEKYTPQMNLITLKNPAYFLDFFTAVFGARTTALSHGSRSVMNCF